MSELNNNIPTIVQLYDGGIVAKKEEQKLFIALMNEPPKKEWVVDHPYIKQEVEVNGQKQKVPYKYIPIGTVEYLLKTIFGEYKIEITGQGTAFNGVWVTVRVHYLNPITKEWSYHDGIGAAQIQVRSGSSPSDLASINNGALSMAFPNAKTIAIKDACDHFGRLFGSDLNRKDYVEYDDATKIIPFDKNHPKWDKAIEALAKGLVTIEKSKEKYPNINDESEKLIKEEVIKYKTNHGLV